MKVAKVLTSKAIFYYTNSGNTKGIIEECNTGDFDIYALKNMSSVELEEVIYNYDTILIGTPTLGRGIPPVYFRNIFPVLNKIKEKNIGLFGSGQTIYGEYFGGALDVLEDFLSQKNRILFNFRYESYPTGYVIEDFNKLLDDVRELETNGK